MLLTRYRFRTSTRAASLEIIVTEGLLPTEFTEYHAAPSYGVEVWKTTTPMRQIKIGGYTANCIDLVADSDEKDVLVKKVVIFGRGSRVFHFVGLHWSSDLHAHQQIKRAMESIVWKT